MTFKPLFMISVNDIPNKIFCFYEWDGFKNFKEYKKSFYYFNLNKNRILKEVLKE